MARLYIRKGSPFFYADLFVAGNRRRFSTEERDQRTAQEKADAEENRLNELARAAEGLHLLEASSRFFLVKELKEKTIDNYNISIANLMEVHGDFALASYSQANIRHYVDSRMKTGATVAIRRDLAFLSSLYNVAKHWDERIKDNPVASYDKTGIPEARKRNRWLRPEEVEKLLKACTADYQRVFILVSVFTGMRLQETLQLRWDEVDFKEEVIFLGNLDPTRTKTGEGRIVPISNRLCHALAGTKRVAAAYAVKNDRPASPYVFVNPRTGEPFHKLKTFWKGVQTRSGVKGIRIHDLRHTFASWGKQNGMDDQSLMDIMGHKTRSMVSRYSHTSLESLRTSMSKLDSVTLGGTQPSDFQSEEPTGTTIA